jgi:hypothetical protein
MLIGSHDRRKRQEFPGSEEKMPWDMDMDRDPGHQSITLNVAWSGTLTPRATRSRRRFMAGKHPERMLDPKTPEEGEVTGTYAEPVEDPALGIEVEATTKQKLRSRLVTTGDSLTHAFQSCAIHIDVKHYANLPRFCFKQSASVDWRRMPIAVLYDVSEVSVLRKRLGQAAISMKVIGLLSAFFAFMSAWVDWQAPFLLSLPFGILVFWCAVRLSKRLRAGDTSAAKIVAVWWLLAVAENLFDALPKALANENVDLFSAIGMAIFTLPLYFIARGLLALRAYKQSRSKGDSRGSEPLMSNPWEGGGKKIEKHPAFVNKRSLILYPLLLLVPLPWIVLRLGSLTSDDPLLSDPAGALGYQMGQLILGTAILLFGTAWLYRRARRSALLPATELSKRNPRPIVLYLRSFLDDKIKMRARHANGRSWLEKAVRVTLEEVITDHLWRYGPVVAIGKPGD